MSYLSRNDRDSIFGDTYNGVPNPQIPFEHAYPTRYHGAIFNVPRFGLTFQPNPMTVTPFSGGDEGMSTEAKIAIGVGVAGAAVALLGWALYRK